MKRTITALVCAVLSLAVLLCAAGCGEAPSGAGTPAGTDMPSAPAAPYAPAAPAAAEPREEITVSAFASVNLVPDRASVCFAVETQGETAEEAQNGNSETVQNVMDVLTGRGVEERSIRTERYDLYPRYDWSDGMERVVGYVVTTAVRVEDQDLSGLGELISACVDAGVTNVNSVTLTCSGYDEAYAEALGQAVAAARTKAEVLAQAAGKALGDAVTITEGWQDTSARYAANSPTSMYLEADSASEAVLQPGETEIRANVTVTFRME